MRAAVQTRYGGPHVLSVRDIEAVEPGPRDVVVAVHAAPVTQGDRRMRSADFPGFSALIGRLMMGVFRPRRAVPGTNFAGRVVAVGHRVEGFAVGDDVFGATMHGAYAECLRIREDQSIAKLPAGLSYAEAAALPYGTVTALAFLRDWAKVQPGEQVLIVGAAGGVGRMAVQVARHLGAEVTGVCSGDDTELVRSLGATHTIDYRTTDVAAEDRRYDVILDTAGVHRFGRIKHALTAHGRFASVYMTLGLLLHMLKTKLTGGRRALTGVAVDSQAAVDEVRALVEAGAVRPVVGRRFPLPAIAEAHAHLEDDRPSASVVVDVAA